MSESSAQEIESKPKEIIVDKQPIIANIIAGVAVLISGFLFYYTYQLFKETQKATTISEKSADAATNAVAEQKKMNRFSIQAQQKSSYQDSINQEKNFKISSNALQVQINSLKQVQADFKAENRPVVKFELLYTSTKDIKNNKISLGFCYHNLGKFPAHNIILSSDIGMGEDTMHINGKLNAINKNLEYLGGGLKSDTIEMIFRTDNKLEYVIPKASVFFFMRLAYECRILKQTYHAYMVYQFQPTSLEDFYFYPIQIKEEFIK